MTLQEALNFGGPFKRSVSEVWLKSGEVGYYCLNKGDLLATDWEVQEKTASISAGQLREASKKVMGLVASSRHYKLLDEFIAELIVELGL